jgi:hypothetical protein
MSCNGGGTAGGFRRVGEVIAGRQRPGESLPEPIERQLERAAFARDLRRLWLAVLVNGLREAAGWVAGDDKARVQRQALAWISSPDFVVVCDLAGVHLDPDAALDAVICSPDLFRSSLAAEQGGAGDGPRGGFSRRSAAH